jgi:transposase
VAEQSMVHGVETKGVGFAPILRSYYERCRIAKFIDDNVPLDARRTTLTHGEASVAMITGILFQVMQLYRFVQFASETTVLQVVFPRIKPEEYFDDRLADTLDALFEYGLGNLETLITQHMIREFNIVTNTCHNDTTSASVYGDYDNNKTANSIRITFGHSKKHRQDLKQFVWSLSVSSDSGFPLFQKAYSGNTADVTTYLEQWQNLVDLLDRNDFLYVADSKLLTKENMAHIHDHDGFFIAPAPMYESYKSAFHAALDNHPVETLLPYKKQINRAFEVPLHVEQDEKIYPFRMIILFDHGLFARKSSTLRDRMEKTRAAFKQLDQKLNKYTLKTEQSIEQACSSILTKYQTGDLFNYTIHSDPLISYKNKKRGRVKANEEVEKVAVIQDRFTVTLSFDESAFDKALYHLGYYPLITNKPAQDLSLHEAMMAHKNQYKCEHTNRRAKSGLNLEPVYLHTPERIEAMLFLFKIALQLLVLMERTARRNIEQRDRGLDQLMPNRNDVRNPKTESLLAAFKYVVQGRVLLHDGSVHGFISQLTASQKDILTILEVPCDYFTYKFLFDSS